jgi:hypothetical protein
MVNAHNNIAGPSANLNGPFIEVATGAGIPL